MYLDVARLTRYIHTHTHIYIYNRYDATFAETEMSQCITEVRRLDPEFNLHIWLDEMKDDTIPHVIKSYLRMDDKALLEHLSEGAMAQVSAAIKVRRDEVRILCVCVFVKRTQ